MEKARNDLSAAVPKFCLALEEHRRTPDGRVRTAQELLTTFFPHDEKSCTDRIFKHLPNEVRGPIVAAWGVRGIKAALRDTDEKVQSVVYDALVAGDIDHAAFEDGLGAETLVRWVPLGELWAFWRGGKLTKPAIQKALSTAYELALFDARWFLETLQSKSGALKGTEVLSEGLSKEDMVAWMKRIHETGDGTPKGLVAALGWEKIANKTRDDALVTVLDAIATKVGLLTSANKDSRPPAAQPETAGGEAKVPLPVGSSEKLPLDDQGWSLRPAPPGGAPVSAPEQEAVTGRLTPEAAPSEEAINIVLDDELLMPESSATTPSPNSSSGASQAKNASSNRPGGKRS